MHPGGLSIEREVHDSLHKRKVREGEEGLMLAILEDGLDCFFKHLLADDKRGRELFAETEAWILDRGSDWIFSFENICETLGIDPSYLRGKLMRWKESELTKKEERGSARCRRKEAVMPILRRLKEVLDQAKISYEIYNHPPAFTAQEIAATQHIPGNEMAKVVILKVDGGFIMAVVPASRLVDLGKAKMGLTAQEVALATEEEFSSLFPECAIGAMPPFGNLFGLPVYVDPALEKDEAIYFNGGNHFQTVRLRYRDFKELVKPAVLSLIAEEKRRKAA